MQRVAALLLVGAALAGAVAAQEEGRAVENPYQAEVTYELGKATDPGVVIAGVRWGSLKLAPRGELRPGGTVKCDLELAFENRSDQDVRIDVVLLLEDAGGAMLHRLEAEPMKLGSGRRKVFDDTYKIPADALSEVRKLYLFCEVTPD